MPPESQIRDAARETVAQMLRTADFTDDDPLISSGRIDSLSILKLMASLEKKLNVHLPAARLQPDDFENVDTIVETVERVAVPK